MDSSRCTLTHAPWCQSENGSRNRGIAQLVGMANHQPQSVTQVDDPASWVKNDIDRFVLAGLNEAKLSPSPDADRLTLVRRLAFDLTGLPPSQSDLQRFAIGSQPAPLEQWSINTWRAFNMVSEWTSLARCSALRRIKWQRRKRNLPLCLALSRLCRRRFQSGHAF